MSKILYLLTALVLLFSGFEVANVCSGSGCKGVPVLMNKNAGFEQGLTGWTTYTEASIASDAIIRVEQNEKAKCGEKCLFMRLPSGAKNNQSQFIHIGQNLQLSKYKRYRFTVDVKWANPENSLSSAIVSIWAKSTDNNYIGKDVWIYDGDGYKNLSFEFTPNANGNVFCYLSLLTHQEGYDNTDIYADEFRIEEIGDAFMEKDPRTANINLLQNPSFDRGFENWNTTLNNPNSISDLNCYLVNDSGKSKLRLELPGSEDPDYLNNTWTGIYQELEMYAGNEYQVEVNIDRIVPDSTQYPTILNIYAYKPGTTRSASAWLGSVDYKFNNSGLHNYSQRITPSETATYEIVVRIFGWGNGGNPFKLNVDNIKVKRIE